MELKWWMFLIVGLMTSFLFFPDITGKTTYPTTLYNYHENLQIFSNNVEISFDSSTDKLYLPKNLIIKKINNTLSISTPLNTKQTYKIIIGSKRSFKKIQINSGKININGTLKSNSFKLIGSGIELNTKFYGKSLYINGADVKILGNYFCNELQINATSIKSNVSLNIKSININSFDFSGTIKYSKINTNSQLKISSKGYLNIFIPKNSNNLLKITKNKIIINTKKY
ncbi:hypothetical protein OSSY52_17250 [Tepiditoga spiralis]|uniref:Adhesin domain-containing protein n=1 Tax=Tepiditoga spiralis TaxID=2108365 RepID=A0A7G1G8M0_9BACT|nr:hypothetical protein [Tepiditoga spiralis]BBE31584.1 hypothetical protein OSSY52_17250 [Tepiditoga spiralis]